MRDEYEITTSIQILIDDRLPVFPADVVRWDMNVTLPCDLLDCNLRLLSHYSKENFFGDNVDISSSANITNSVIGDNVKITQPVTITNSMIMSDTIVSTGRDLDEVIVFGDSILQCTLSGGKQHRK